MSGRIKVLIVEDDESSLNLYDMALSDDIFEKHKAVNGLAAVKEYAAWKPDIIILDILMPKMLGYSVLKEIRKLHDDSLTTIIVSSSVDSEADIKYCEEQGIQGYIIKPFNHKKLASEILAYHEKAKAGRLP